LFLSSTATDLAPFREVVLHVCQRLGAAVVAMEEFGPDPRAAAELCREKVESADLFLGLYAHRYGYVPDGFAGRSITELEYEWAIARRPAPPLLLFVVDDELAWPPKWIDRGESWERLQEFIKRLRTSHVTGTLTTPEQLREDLFVHLPRFLDQAPTAAVAPRLPPLPAPPEPFVAHQYTLLQTARVIGREAELARLDAWVGDPEAARLLSLVAIGGMGKSALTWKWFHERAPQAMVPLSGRLWWSFYEADAGFDRFVVAALAYCSGQPVDAVMALSPVDREYQLLSLLDRVPFLFVLDGLERVLIAYANLDFAHLADEDLDRSTGHAIAQSGHAPGTGGLLGRHRLRQTIDPRTGEFLRKLTRVRASRTLVTTRLFPSELQTVTGHVLPGSAAWFLAGMQPEDALALWRAMGVSGDDAELERLFISIEHYPLLIRALAGEVAGYRPAPGDLDAWRRAHPDFDPFALPLVQAKSHVLAYALSDLGADASEVLQTVAAFRAPVDYQTVAALFVQRHGWSPRRLDGVLTDLEDRGLLGWDRGANRYDLHPVVRGVVWSGLDDVRRRALYGQLEQHFTAGPAASAEIRSVEDALPVIELMRALIGLGRYEDAADLYFDRLHRSIDFSFTDTGMGHVNIALLEGLFPAGIEQPPAVQPNHVTGVLAQLGHAYQVAGRLSDAHRFGVRNIEGRKPGKTDAQLYRQVSQRDLELGRLRMALERAGLAAMPGDKYDAVNLALCEATVGRYDAALRRLASLRADEYYNPHRSETRVRLWMGEFDRAAELGRRALPWAARYFDARLELTIDVAEADLHLGRLDEATGTLMDILREARSKALTEVEMDSLRCLADAYRLRGDHTSARAFLDDLDEIAARGPYRLIQADAANIRALLPDADPAQRRADGEQAYLLAWCDGPPYAYHRALELATRTLRDLGTPLPKASS
jgi:tetratricopeptide (TPR) repeat protein